MQANVSTVGATVYLQIKRDIIYGDLAPGSKLKLNTLNKLYDVSLSTLRETLNRLASDGFVKAEEQRGFFVAPVSRQDLVEITELRVLLECSAVKTSVDNGDTDWEGSLASAHHKLSVMENRMLENEDAEKERWKRYDREFHLALIQACNSKNMLDIHAVVYDKYLRYQMLVLTHRGEEAADEHKAMFDSALRRDSNATAGLLESHIRRGLSHTLDSMGKDIRTNESIHS